MQFFRRNYLPMTVFLTGAAVLIIEVVAVRILSPYFGSTIFTVSSVLTVVLAALSVGYYIGGRLADRQPTNKMFFGIILVGGLMVLVLQWMQVLFLPMLGEYLPLTSGPLITSALLFFVPSVLLGMLSPFAIKLAESQGKGQGLGSIVGTIFFFSTMGSISGSLAAGYVLVPNFGVGAIILGVGAGLVVLGLGPLVYAGMQRQFAVKLGVVSVLLVGLYALPATGHPGTLYYKNGIYENIQIIDGTYRDRPVRFLFQDRSASAAMYLDGDDLVYDYSKYYALHELFVPKVDRSLVIGGGGYSIPKVIMNDLPETTVDAVEIEPSLVDLGERFFDTPKNDPRLDHIVADGRRFLNDTDRTYDLIFSDVYASFYSIPMHFTTKEFFQLAYNKMNDEGLFIANVIGSLDSRPPSMFLSELRTMQEVFPQVYAYGVDSQRGNDIQNIILVGHKSKQRQAFTPQQLQQSRHDVIRNLDNHAIQTEQIDLQPYPILTDNFAPVESWTAELLRRHKR